MAMAGSVFLVFTVWLFRSEIHDFIADAIAEGIQRGKRGGAND